MIGVKEIRTLEKNAENKGLSKLTMMENAGKAVAGILLEKKDLKGKRVLIACYHGNNGGDGFVAARHLADKTEVDVLFVGDEEKLKEEAKVNFDRIQNNELIQFISPDYVDFDDYDAIIDALLGTGSHGSLEYPLSSVVEGINDAKGFKLSIDIPSGLNPDTGEGEKMVNADLIVSLHDVKNGLEKLKGKVVVADIGLNAPSL